MERIRADVLHGLIADGWPSVRAFWEDRLKGKIAYSTMHEIYTGVTGNPRRIADLASALNVTVDVLYGREPAPAPQDRYYTLDTAIIATAPYRLQVSSIMVRQLSVPIFSVVTDIHLTVVPWNDVTSRTCWLCVWRPTGQDRAILADVVDAEHGQRILPGGHGAGILLSDLDSDSHDAPGQILGAIGPDLSVPCLSR